MHTTADVARMSGVSSRTLRHYDAIGLLPPADIGAGGVRLYGDAELLVLQRILVLRELGMPLADIAAVLDDRVDPVTALRDQRDRLQADRARLAGVLRTIETTIDDLERQQGADTVTIHRPENLFEGFDPTEYDAEAAERWPDEAARSRAFAETLSSDDLERMQREQTALMIRTADLMAAGVDVTDERVQAEARLAYRSMHRMWQPTAEQFRGVGLTIADDPRFAENYERIAPGLAAYTRDAYAAFAAAELD